MNRAKLEQCLWQRVRLRPIAGRRTPEGQWLPAIDDEWIPTELSERGLRIRNVRTQHAPLVGLVRAGSSAYRIPAAIEKRLEGMGIGGTR